MNIKTKSLVMVSLSICLILSLLFTGCVQTSQEPEQVEQPAPPATKGPGTVTTPPPESPQSAGTQMPASAPSVPIKINLSVSKELEFNKPTELTCTISSLVDAPNTEARVKLPAGATLISGTLNWQGGLKAKEPLSFSSQIVFDKEGKWAIEGIVSDKSNGWGDVARLYLTIGADHSELGWPPTGPVPVKQIEKGEIEPVPSSSTREPPIEELPKPPSITLDGAVQGQQEHHSITVTGTFKYWTDLDDYRTNPNSQVGAKTFLVELLSDDGTHKAYGYTNSEGYFSITGVDPAGKIKARWWCYVKYAPNDSELRVVYSGNSLTGLTDVWHTGFTNSFEFPDDGQSHSMGTFSLDANCDGDGAFWIKDDLDRTYNYLYNQGAIDLGSATVRWTESSSDGDHYDYNGTDQIHLLDVTERRPDVVIHEYGHNVMDNVYGFLPPTNYGQDGTHYLFWNETAGTAWVEGWANFLPLVAQSNAVNPQYPWIWELGDYTQYDLEEPTWQAQGQPDDDWDDGDAVSSDFTQYPYDYWDDIESFYTIIDNYSNWNAWFCTSAPETTWWQEEIRSGRVGETHHLKNYIQTYEQVHNG